MLVGRHPVGHWVSDRFEVTSTAQLFGTEALGHPARHLRDVTKLRSFDEDALDAQGFEFPGRFRTSRRVRRWRRRWRPTAAPGRSASQRRAASSPRAQVALPRKNGISAGTSSLPGTKSGPTSPSSSALRTAERPNEGCPVLCVPSESRLVGSDVTARSRNAR